MRFSCTFPAPLVPSSPLWCASLPSRRLIAMDSLFARTAGGSSSDGHVHARTCAICLRAQCPLISTRYTLAGRRSVMTNSSLRIKTDRIAIVSGNWLEGHVIITRVGAHLIILSQFSSPLHMQFYNFRI